MWKFKLAHAHSITTPYGAKTLCVQEQRGHIYVWMEVNPRENREEKHYFDIIGTGWEIPQDVKRQYVGTVLQSGGSLVWHVYERFE